MQLKAFDYYSNKKNQHKINDLVKLCVINTLEVLIPENLEFFKNKIVTRRVLVL